MFLNELATAEGRQSLARSYNMLWHKTLSALACLKEVIDSEKLNKGVVAATLSIAFY